MLSTLALLACLSSPPANDVEFTPTVFDRGQHLRVRLLCEGGQAPDAIEAKGIVSAAKASGQELKQLEGIPSTGNEVRRPDNRVVVWIDLEAPREKAGTLKSLEGELLLLAGGEEKKLRGKKFQHTKRREVKSKEFASAGVEVEALLTEIDAYRFEGHNGTGKIMDLRMGGAQCDYHALTGPEDAHLVAHLRKGKMPKGSEVIVEVKDASGAVHAIRLEDIKASGKAKLVGEEQLAPLGVELTVVKTVDNQLTLSVESERSEVVECDLMVGDELVPFDDVATTTQEAFRLVRTKSYPAFPKGSEVVVTIREGAQWSAVPFSLSNVPIKR